MLDFVLSNCQIRFNFTKTMENEKLCLKWNDFQDIIRKSFGELRSNNDFTDVTLACEDQSIKAHKVILSACSPFFKRLLKTYSHPQPLMFLRGVKAKDLIALVDFIYLGAASIDLEQLESFLALAEEFELKGFAESSEESVTEHINTKQTEPVHPNYKIDFARKNKETLSNMTLENKEFEEKVVPVQSKAKQTGYTDPGTMSKIESMVERIEEGYACTNCDYNSMKRSHMMAHVEKHIAGLKYPCNFCYVVLRSSPSFRAHKRRCVGYQNKK